MTIPRIKDPQARAVIIKATIKIAGLQGWAISEGKMSWLELEPSQREKLNPRIEMWTQWAILMYEIFIGEDPFG